MNRLRFANFVRRAQFAAKNEILAFVIKEDNIACRCADKFNGVIQNGLQESIKIFTRLGQQARRSLVLFLPADRFLFGLLPDSDFKIQRVVCLCQRFVCGKHFIIHCQQFLIECCQFLIRCMQFLRTLPYCLFQCLRVNSQFLFKALAVGDIFDLGDQIERFPVIAAHQ